ncbi:hypothetical protein SKAU_G00353740 [Synaphobranchus kaupii]|uniref:Uncharacterized protein n=1 Tax=Synaphobranchus kaupii TaxID=118154 RepID=A0A9Q1IIF2_SYNKA|nr:hypothetical protein SKAU_G00353740 [Synaphobranchus kaupii]
MASQCKVQLNPPGCADNGLHIPYVGYAILDFAVTQVYPEDIQMERELALQPSDLGVVEVEIHPRSPPRISTLPAGPLAGIQLCLPSYDLQRTLQVRTRSWG